MLSKFLWKVLLNGIFTVPMLLFFSQASLIGALFASLGLSVIAFLIGDQMILRLTNNTVATVADIGLAFIYFWMAAFIAGWTLSFMEMVIMSLVVGILEFFFHGYLQQDKNRMGKRNFS